MLVDSFADDFRPEDYTDEYRVELQQLIEAKLEGDEAFPTPEKEEEGEDAEVVDLLAALQRSVERHKGEADEQRRQVEERNGEDLVHSAAPTNPTTCRRIEEHAHQDDPAKAARKTADQGGRGTGRRDQGLRAVGVG